MEPAVFINDAQGIDLSAMDNDMVKSSLTQNYSNYISVIALDELGEIPARVRLNKKSRRSLHLIDP